ncbi:hypothetical protein ASF56_16270 [Methylobacterium sp. Leaf122]|nr:DUF2213 domain-containing protein [Methylobacterium sp. Leaf122]KQQ24107.1 hypothetical protein ASF56_16270 [Methylobacterium sp. Leaf122]
MLNLFDAAPISTRRKTGDGYLVAEARAARLGVQLYEGAEVGKPEMGVVRVMRPEAEVFDRTSISSYGSAPITVGHPPGGVTADTWKRFAVGHVGEGVVRDGEYVAIPLILKDADAIRQLEGGTRELSVGYTCNLDWSPGSEGGQTWDAVQRGIRVNHVALVPKGRAGAECRISDSATNLQQRTHSMANNITPPMGFMDAIPSPEAAQVASIIADLQSNETFRVRQAGQRARDLSWQYGAQMGRTTMGDARLPKIGFDFLTALADQAPAIEATLLGRWAQGDASVSTGIDRDAGTRARAEMIEQQANAWRTPLGATSGSAVMPQTHDAQPLGDAATEYERMCERQRNAWQEGK